MQETWRWFGPNDSVTLGNVLQAGASGAVSSLHEIPTGMSVVTISDVAICTLFDGLPDRAAF